MLMTRRLFFVVILVMPLAAHVHGQSAASVLGPEGAMLVFFRSADW
jgi:hypothetical protein